MTNRKNTFLQDAPRAKAFVAVLVASILALPAAGPVAALPVTAETAPSGIQSTLQGIPAAGLGLPGGLGQSNAPLSGASSSLLRDRSLRSGFSARQPFGLKTGARQPIREQAAPSGVVAADRAPEEAPAETESVLKQPLDSFPASEGSLRAAAAASSGLTASGGSVDQVYRNAGEFFDRLGRNGFSAATEPVAVRSGRASYRPPVEWWTVKGRRFESTRDLLASGVADRGPVAAVYHHRPSAVPFGFGRRAAAALGGAVAGTGIAAVTGLLLSIVGSVVSLVVFSDTREAGMQAVYLFSAMGAAIGAVSAFAAYGEYGREGEQISGTLRRRGNGRGSLAFDLGYGKGVIGLARYSRAQVLQRESAPRRWYDFFLGVAAVPGFVIGSLIPLLCAFLPPAAGIVAINALSDGTHMRLGLRTLLGIVLGYGAAAALWTGINVLGWIVTLQWAGVAALAVGLLGFLLGPQVRSGSDYADKRIAAKPWWGEI